MVSGFGTRSGGIGISRVCNFSFLGDKGFGRSGCSWRVCFFRFRFFCVRFSAFFRVIFGVCGVWGREWGFFRFSSL